MRISWSLSKLAATIFKANKFSPLHFPAFCTATANIKARYCVYTFCGIVKLNICYFPKQNYFFIMERESVLYEV